MPKRAAVPREVLPLAMLVATAGVVGATFSFMTLKKGRETKSQPWPYLDKDPAKVSEMRRQMAAAGGGGGSVRDSDNDNAEVRQTARRVHDVLKADHSGR